MNLSQKRISRDMTQAELASKLGVAQNTVAQWETGKRSPRIYMLKKIAQLFDCTIDDLLNEPSEPDAPASA